jgi:nicotinate-nucleotide adenylyltransferase
MGTMNVRNASIKQSVARVCHKVSKKVGFFAGSFDPVHDGHLEVARTVIRAVDLDELYFMVEEKPWGNKRPIDVVHRQAMVDLAIENEPKTAQLDLSEKQFSIQATLPILKKIYPNYELHFIFGADVFMHMEREKWPNLEKLLEHHIVVFERGKVSQSNIIQHANRLGINVLVLSSKLPYHNSTDVRATPHNKTVWLPKRVAEYIQENSLY